jgi:hypothetical protein
MDFAEWRSASSRAFDAAFHVARWLLLDPACLFSLTGAGEAVTMAV